MKLLRDRARKEERSEETRRWSGAQYLNGYLPDGTLAFPLREGWSRKMLVLQLHVAPGHLGTYEYLNIRDLSRVFLAGMEVVYRIDSESGDELSWEEVTAKHG